jgi:hypothetical protein
MNLKDIRKMKRAIQPKPVEDISDLLSLRDNFAYSVLLNTKYKDEIEGYSVVELSSWLKEHQIYNDFDLIQLTIDTDEDN